MPGAGLARGRRLAGFPRLDPDGAVKLLVTGGAGYVGSVVAKQLLAAGHAVVVLDDLSRGHGSAIPDGAAHVNVNLLDAEGVHEALGAGFDGVLHFAALALVAESVQHPERYWRNNVTGTFNLLEAMRAHGVQRLVFSSTCAVYGEPERVPMDETTPTSPVNAYGASKLAVDYMLTSECRAHGLGATSLRYFNVAGASGGCGEHHEPETHIIPLVLQVALGQREHVSLFGTDYPTRDGSAVRDYIHIEDLGRAHLLALEGSEPGRHAIYNLGNGTGFSVREVIEAARRVTGHPIPVREEPRRPGDPAQLVAASQRIREELGWTPEKPDLDAIIADAWAWHQAHPRGYAD
jgi:UDP-glucose 4-epimerase